MKRACAVGAGWNFAAPRNRRASVAHQLCSFLARMAILIIIRAVARNSLKRDLDPLTPCPPLAKEVLHDCKSH
jgi:hypothetical protein